MKLSQVQMDVEAMEEGEWHPHPYFDGVQIKVRSSSCDAVEKRRTHLLNRLPAKRRKTGDSLEANRKVESLCTAACLLEVKGLDDVTYSEELGREWAIDPRMRHFLEGVREVADEIGQREAAVQEDDLSD